MRANRCRLAVSGFTLIELLIVVTVIAILAALAVPNLAAAKGATNEATAISGLRVISNGMEAWRARNRGGDGGYPADFKQLAVGLPGEIDPLLGTGQRAGYVFAGGGDLSQYQILAVPVAYGVTGHRSFYVDATGVIRGADHGGAAADSSDPPIQ
jgi:prepilin-type N-terminal cleavage/methylation domain-containing protein